MRRRPRIIIVLVRLYHGIAGTSLTRDTRLLDGFHSHTRYTVTKQLLHNDMI